MKYLSIFILLAQSVFAWAQPGLQSIYVETYYVTSEDDRKDTLRSGPLEKGSVVYRIYADLEPGYRFQAAYGSPEHPLEITSDRMFFNHNHSGNTQPEFLPERDLAKNITLIDSWLSSGAATENHLGIPRKHDMILQDSYLRFESGFLANTVQTEPDITSPLKMPLSQCDGLERTDKMPVTTFYMLDSLKKVLHSVTKGNRIYIDNGAWACMGKGSVGADSTSGNHVLLAQLTTAGAVNYKLNIMIGTPEGKSIRYVHSNPIDGETLHPALTGSYIWRNTAIKEEKKRAKRKSRKK
jgi:hypothetical protein